MRSGWISTKKPLSFEWAMEHMAYDAGRRAAGGELMDDVKGRDLDETRRLLYMALYASQTDRYNLVGTLVNALVHHGSGMDPDEAGRQVLAAVHGADTAWLREQIARLTAEEKATG